MKSSNTSSILGITSLLAAIAMPIVASAATSVPTPKKTVAPHLSGALTQASGEVRLLVNINEYGFVTDATVADSSNTELNAASLDAIHLWTFSPAKEDGVAVPSKAIQPFYFNGGSIVLESKQAPSDTNPIVRNTSKPTLSDDLMNITGEVVLQASLSSDGNVESVMVKSSTHSELEEAASAALQKWTFKPATKSGEAVASKVIIPFRFEGTGESHEAVVASVKKSVDRAPTAIRQPTPELSRELQDQRGEAKLQLTVDSHGYVANVDILESSNEALSTAAREAALQWKFKPAIKDGAAVASTVIQPFSFNGGLLSADLPVDSMPVAKFKKSPELPEALTDVQGYVSIRLNLDAQGRVVNASCTKSSHDELVAPTVEAAKAWTFKPAVRDGEKVPSSVLVPFIFNKRT